jgi:hypothetical protein
MRFPAGAKNKKTPANVAFTGVCFDMLLEKVELAGDYHPLQPLQPEFFKKRITCML